jgi:hypothetical protein
MRSKTIKGLVNLSQKILSCWASRTDKMSGLCPRQHFRHRAEDRKGQLLCSCARIAVFQHRRGTPSINWLKVLSSFANSPPKRGPDRCRLGPHRCADFQRLIKEIERNQAGSGFTALLGPALRRARLCSRRAHAGDLRWFVSNRLRCCPVARSFATSVGRASRRSYLDHSCPHNLM